MVLHCWCELVLCSEIGLFAGSMKFLHRECCALSWTRGLVVIIVLFFCVSEWVVSVCVVLWTMVDLLYTPGVRDVICQFVRENFDVSLDGLFDRVSRFVEFLMAWLLTNGSAPVIIFNVVDWTVYSVFQLVLDRLAVHAAYENYSI